MKMGYHKDSKYFPSISSFHGEMRRRVWALVQHSDLIIFFTFGLPPMIQNAIINTNLLSNLYDDELYEDMSALPPLRPSSEVTSISYIIYKSKLINIGVKVIEEVQKLSKSSYDTIMVLDRELREVYENISPHFKMRTVDEPF